MVEAVLSPVDQTNVAPGVAEVPVSVDDGEAQVSTTSLPALASGDAIFWFTTADELAVQPLAGSVTVTV